MVSVPARYDHMTPWSATASHGPILRGRRHDGPATTLHFVHGNGFCGGVYWPLLHQLLPHYGLFCHDFEGHGESDPPARFSGAAAITARIAEVITELRPGGQALIGVGHSYGAALTVRVAAARPQLFRALILLDPILMPTHVLAATRLLTLLRRNPMAMAACRRRDRWASRQQAWEHLHGRGIYKGWRDDAFDSFIDHATHDADGARVLSCPKWLEAEIFSHPIYPWRALRQLRCPVLYVYGTQTYGFVAQAARGAARACATLEVQTQAGGHCFMQEDPQTTAQMMRAFLEPHQL